MRCDYLDGRGQCSSTETTRCWHEWLCPKHAPVFDKRLEEEDQRYEATLHDLGDGRLRVGASSLYIRRHPENDKWGIYADSLEGPRRIRGAWEFGTQDEARVRAFAVAKEMACGSPVVPDRGDPVVTHRLPDGSIQPLG